MNEGLRFLIVYLIGVPLTFALVWLIYVVVGLLIDPEETKEVFLKMKKKEDRKVKYKNIFQDMGNNAIEIQMAKALLNRGIDGAKEILDLAKDEGTLSDFQYVRLLLLVNNDGIIPEEQNKALKKMSAERRESLSEKLFTKDGIPRWAAQEPEKHAEYIAHLKKNKNARH